MTIENATWELTRLGEALEAISRHRGWIASDPSGMRGLATPDGDVGPWLERAAESLGVEAEPVTVSYACVDAELGGLGAAIVVVVRDSERRFLAILRTSPSHAYAVISDGSTVAVRIRELRQALCGAIEARTSGDVTRVLAMSGVGGRRLSRSRSAMLRELVGDASLGEIWLIRPRLENVQASVRDAGLSRNAVTFAVATIADMMLWTTSWWILGLMAFGSRSLDTLFALWLLAVVSLIPLRAAGVAAARSLIVGAASILKRRMLAGALKLTPDEVLGQGAGTFLSHVLEASAVEGLGPSGAFGALTAVVGAVAATYVISRGAGGPLHGVLFVIWIVITTFATLRFGRARAEWTDARFALTGHVVENMIGHKTRLAQKYGIERNTGEDRRLEAYAVREAVQNRASVTLEMLRRTWPWVGLFALAPIVVLGTASRVSIAISAGGVLLGATALTQWVEASATFAAAVVAWRRIRPFWHAADRRDPLGSFAVQRAATDEAASSLPLLYASSVTYRHRNREAAVLDQLDLVMRSGERVLVTGHSGSGKSTLSAILSGGRPLQSGLLFFRGLDITSVGVENWRRRVLLVPQFHSNHIFIGTLAYNLLLGRTWPASSADMEEAESVCRGLGLGALIDRMPLGLSQPVGESGWQLSHGERARVYIARAILQNPALMILDETFAALDPATLGESIDFVLDRANALLVVAHT